MSLDPVLAYGQAFALFYERFFGDYAEKAAPRLLNFYASQPVSRTHPHVLDLGCGTGQLALRFLEAGYSFLGLDLSPHMLFLAEKRCWNYVATHKVRFLEADMSHFRLGGPFGMVVSTYNSINHLEDERKLKGCFDSTRNCLAPGGVFLFDFHTEIGLREWTKPERGEWEEGRVEVRGDFDPHARKASMRLEGNWAGQDFCETITNRTLPLEELRQLLNGSGFARVVFAGLDDLHQPLKEPESEPRVVVLAS